MQSCVEVQVEDGPQGALLPTVQLVNGGVTIGVVQPPPQLDVLPRVSFLASRTASRATPYRLTSVARLAWSADLALGQCGSIQAIRCGNESRTEANKTGEMHTASELPSAYRSELLIIRNLLLDSQSGKRSDHLISRSSRCHKLGENTEPGDFYCLLNLYARIHAGSLVYL